ncbi:MAG: hypothetical protein EA397_17270 [Deltaproteobacteria bacterium]|nr:MAG: hypothetical protein EA397_17270 [Deltaproteobacteria bacterium]
MRTSALLIGLVFSASVSHASDCEAPYTIDDLLGDLNTAEFAAQDGDNDTAVQAARRLQDGLGCLQERLMPAIVGRTYRTIGAGLIVGGDEDRGSEWFRTAIEVDPLFDFGIEEFPDDHPVRIVFNKIKQEPQGADPESVSRPFREGKHFLDGRNLSSPQAQPGRPHLFQRDHEGVKSWLIEGAAFPEEALVDEAAALAAAKKEEKKKDKKKAPTSRDDGALAVGRTRPPEKIPLIIGGAVVTLGSAAMFGGAILTRQRFEDIKDSEDDLRSARVMTNRLHMGSIALFAVGAGTTTWGVIIDNGTPMPHISVKF